MLFVWLRRFVGLALLVFVSFAAAGMGADRLFTTTDKFTVVFDGKQHAQAETVTDAIEHTRFVDGRVRVIGHSGTRGDAAANLTLSRTRAKLIADEMKAALGEDYRIVTKALGGTAPLPQEPEESDRAYQGRLARVDIIIEAR